MATNILGLPDSAKFQSLADRFNSHRRRILTLYPNGGSTLTGILSMLESEPVTDSIMYWYEERYISPKTTLRGTNPVTTNAPTSGDANSGTAVSTGATNITTDLFIKVASTARIQPGHVLTIDTDPNIMFNVLQVVHGVTTPDVNGYVKVRLTRATSFGTIATIFAEGTVLRVIGSSYGEGQTGQGVVGTGFRRPIRVENTTQIFRDPFTFPGSVLKMELKYDKTGPYRKKARDTVVDHMTSLERSLLWGRRATFRRSSLDYGQEDLTYRHFSGIMEFLELWDAGSDGLNIDGSTYAPYSFKAPSTTDSDANKRVLANANGEFTVQDFNDWAERVTRYKSNMTKDRLVITGNGALLALNEMFRRNSQFPVSHNDRIMGLSLTTVQTPFANFHLTTHPLFNEDPVFRNQMMILDIHAIKLRPLLDRDTTLLKNRHNPGDDLRKDEYLTEMGLEFWHPENHLVVKNVSKYVEA